MSGDSLQYTNLALMSGDSLQYTNLSLMSGDSLQYTNLSLMSGDSLQYTNLALMSGDSLQYTNLALMSGDSLHIFFHLLSKDFIAFCRASNSFSDGQASVSCSRTSHRFNTDPTPALWCSMSFWIS
jgi:hypothetical protein